MKTITQNKSKIHQRPTGQLFINNSLSIKSIVTLFHCLITTISLAQTNTENHITTTTPTTPTTNVSNLNANEKRTITTYLDGLGRPIQQVAHAQSPSNRDIIQINEYDAFGRTAKQYLPYTTTQTAGSFSTTAVADQTTFYGNTARVAFSAYPFSETNFDNSPLNRSLEQSAPGQDWQLGSGHTIQTSYELNAANEVRLFTESSGNITSGGFYSANQLFKSVSTDEHGNTTTVFSDKEGQEVLKKVQLDATTYAETYLVYNHQNQLVGVIPPQAYADMSTYDVNAEIADRVYRYTYDNRGRLVEKKIPHKGWEYIVYDKLDRPILTQDALQRTSNQWSFNKFDALGRVILTGLYTNSGGRTALQTSADAATNIYETRTGSNYSTQHGYTNVAFPTGIIPTTLDIHTVNYFDDYDFDNNGSTDYSFSTPPIGYTLTSASNRTRSLETGSKVKVLDGNNTFLTTVSWYDEKRRPIQTYSTNYLNGYERTHTAYNFISEVTKTTLIHFDGNQTTITLNQRFNYDHAGRLKQTYHQVNQQDEILYCENFYNELGELIDKKLHSTNLTEPKFLQSIDYAYNIRGWLTHINNADLDEDQYIADNTTPGTVLSFDIENIEFTVNEINNETDGHYLELLMEDQSDMTVSGTVNNSTYENNGAASVFMMLYPENDPSNQTVFNDILGLNGQSFTLDYSSEILTINNQTDLEDLQTNIFDDVETALQTEPYTYAPGVEKIQTAVFNYVAGKTAHVLQTQTAAFSSEYLQFYFEERNGYQLYMNVYDATQSQSWDVFLMDNTAANQPQYDHLYGLTNSTSFPPVTTVIVVDFANANLHEGMGTVAAINECKRYLATITSANGITHQRTLDQMEAFAVNYAVNAFGNVFFNDDANDLWGMELKYNAITNNNNNFPFSNSKLYNGNISEMTWKGRGDTQKRGYGYQYDGLNRLTKAVYRGYNPTAGNWNKEAYRYNVPSITYDLNGNILSLQRKGFKSGVINQNASFGTIDNLSYTYSGDQLLSVSDASIHYQNDFNDGNTVGNDYVYDVNGNMTQDKNKDISITYNHLNLPTTVTNTNNQTITYIYDAVGVKLRKTYINQGSSSTTDYSAIGNYLTANGGERILDFIFTEDGRLVDDNNTFRYEYYYKDHLGNNRLGFSDYDSNGELSTTEISQQTNYYPFGLSHQGTYYGTPTLTSHKYLYNSMEEQNEMGIHHYDFGARNYDAAISRWSNIDPLAEKMRRHSPYNYGFNNPIYFVDPDGMSPVGSNCKDCKEQYVESTETKYTFMGATPEGGVHDFKHIVTQTKKVYNDDYTEVTETTVTTTYSVNFVSYVDDDGNTFIRQVSSKTSRSESQTFENKREVVYTRPNAQDFKDTKGAALTEKTFEPGPNRNYSKSEYLSLEEQHEAISGYSIYLKKQLQANRKFNPYKGDAKTNMIITGVSGGAAIGVGLLNIDKRIKVAFSAGVLIGNLARNFLDHEGRSTTLGSSQRTFWK